MVPTLIYGRIIQSIVILVDKTILYTYECINIENCYYLSDKLHINLNC